jgi:hypothetical protein
MNKNIYLNEIESNKKIAFKIIPYTGLSVRTNHLFSIQQFDKQKLSHINNNKK